MRLLQRYVRFFNRCRSVRFADIPLKQNKRHVVATEKLRANVEYWQKRWVIQADWAKDARVAVMKREQGKGVRFAVDGSASASASQPSLITPAKPVRS